MRQEGESLKKNEYEGLALGFKDWDTLPVKIYIKNI